MHLRTIRVALAAGALLIAAGLIGAPASAYIPPGLQIKLSGPSAVVKCNTTVELTAKVVDTNNHNKPIRLQNVDWELVRTQSSNDRLSDRVTSTNSKGLTSVILTFGLVEGTREIEASAAREKDSIIIRCAGGLPPTFTDLPGSGSTGAPFTDLAPILALLAVASGVVLLGRRYARR